MVAMNTGPPTDLTQKIHSVLFLALDVQLERQRGDAVHTRELAAEFGNLGLKVCLAQKWKDKYTNWESSVNLPKLF